MKKASLFIPLSLILLGCHPTAAVPNAPLDAAPTTMSISRDAYRQKLVGFWKGQCVANFTGRITEMDKVGKTHDFDTLPFYTRDDWGGPDQPAIWAEGQSSDLSPTIDFVVKNPKQRWDADDDTDIEYMYQYLLHALHATVLSGEQIRNGWMTHIKKEEENYLWGANQESFNLMQKGVVPPQTGAKQQNPNWYYIDAQLTTEIFGLLAPARPDVALKMADLPIGTVAREDAKWIAQFYVSMHALASRVDGGLSNKEKVNWLARHARPVLPEGSYSADMFDFIWSQYHDAHVTWETARDALYKRYQLDHTAGYNIPATKDLYCDGCFAAGINFGASMVSLLWGQGDLKETIKIGALAGWDADNPTSTWGGLLGFLIGDRGVEGAFGQKISNQFNIHHTRQNFPNDGLDTFQHMADQALEIIDNVVTQEMGGQIDTATNSWIIPLQ